MLSTRNPLLTLGAALALAATLTASSSPAPAAHQPAAPEARPLRLLFLGHDQPRPVVEGAGRLLVQRVVQRDAGGRAIQPRLGGWQF